MMRKALVILALAAMSLPALAGETPAVRFDAAGLSVDGKRVDGNTLELRAAGESALLASARCIEPLSGAVSVELATGRTMTIEPGVRLERTAEGFRLSSAAGRAVAVSGPEGEISLAPTVDFSVAAEGWTLAGQPVAAASLAAALPAQDGAGSLGRMRQASQRVLGRRPNSNKMIWVFPYTRPHAFMVGVDSYVVRQLSFTSPAGF